MHFTAGSSTKLCAAAMAVGALGLLTSAPSSHARPPAPLAPPALCSFTKATLGISRSDGETLGVNAQLNGTTLGPRGTLFVSPPSNTEFDKSNGNVNGSIDSNQFAIDFTITYDDGPVFGKSEHYHGFISDTGAVTGFVSDTTPQINWKADPGFAKCNSDTIVPDVTATVGKESNVYDAPHGNRIAAPFFLAVGRQLSLASKCSDNWCLLIIPDLPAGNYGSLPAGQGWVYEGEGFLTVK
jgi:hypothetical protein